MSERINDEWTVEKLLDEFEGGDFSPEDLSKDHFLCDFCSKGVAYTSEPRVAAYVADAVLNPDHPVWQRASSQWDSPIVPLASYCEECSTKQLMYPCEGYAEVRIMFDLGPDQTMTNVEVTDISTAENGIPWDPIDLSTKITEVDWDAKQLLATLVGKNHLWGPENVVTFFLSFSDDVDIREVVNYDGSIDPKALGRARKAFREYQEKIEREGHDRQTFRDHVRGNDS